MDYSRGFRQVKSLLTADALEHFLLGPPVGPAGPSGDAEPVLLDVHRLQAEEPGCNIELDQSQRKNGVRRLSVFSHNERASEASLAAEEEFIGTYSKIKFFSRGCGRLMIF